MDNILVVNSGSSSVKFQLYAADGSRRLERLVKGSIDGVGTRPRTGMLPILIRLRIMVVTTAHVITRVVTIITDDDEGHRELSKA
jgi:acetate kinase